MAKQNKQTEIMNNSRNITQILEQQEQLCLRVTEKLDATSTNVTHIMGRTTYIPIDSVGTNIQGYFIKSIIAENTGEATLLLGEKNNVLYALKIYHQNKRPKEKLIEAIRNINNESVLCPIEVGEYINRYFEVLPYYSNGDLASNLPIDNEILESIIIPSINNGLHSIHEKGIIHRDIKPSNIFFSNDKKRVVIGDFGISSVLGSEISIRVTNTSRTLGYAAPETSNGFVSKEADYYSFGITLWHIVLGQDPFAGMTDTQILTQTLTKKIELPQTLDGRISELIRGLTLKERSDRWGYDEVRRWLNKERVTIIERNTSSIDIKPYQFNQASHYDLTSLSLAFCADWETAKKHLYRGLVERFLIQFGEEITSNCMDLKEITDKDVAVFNLIYLLNPNAPLCYKGELFHDLESLGMKMANQMPTMNEKIFELIINGCFQTFLEHNRYDKGLIQKVSEITKEINNGKKEYYFALMYLFNPQKGYAANGSTFISIIELVDYLENLDEKEREKTAEVIIDDILFYMWVYAQGYNKQLEQWRKIYEKAEW